jgi:hypothetical protein
VSSGGLGDIRRMAHHSNRALQASFPRTRTNLPSSYIATMPKSKRHQRWRVSRIRGPRLEIVGVVPTPNPDAAIKVAIEENKITDPWKQNRLVARPED